MYQLKIKWVREAINIMDVNADSIASVGSPFKTEIEEMVLELDPNPIFMVLLMAIREKLSEITLEEELMQSFKIFDEDNDGLIDNNIWRYWKTERGNPLAQSGFEYLIRGFEEDGMINYKKLSSKMERQWKISSTAFIVLICKILLLLGVFCILKDCTFLTNFFEELCFYINQQNILIYYFHMTQFLYPSLLKILTIPTSYKQFPWLRTISDIDITIPFILTILLLLLKFITLMLVIFLILIISIQIHQNHIILQSTLQILQLSLDTLEFYYKASERTD